MWPILEPIVLELERNRVVNKVSDMRKGRQSNLVTTKYGGVTNSIFYFVARIQILILLEIGYKKVIEVSYYTC